MSVYVFNILVDYMPNGIDNAQGYREKIFNQIGIDGYYVFTNFPKMRNISLYNNVGIPVNKMVNPILKMTGRDYFDFDAETDVMVLELEQNLNVDKVIYVENAVQIPSAVNMLEFLYLWAPAILCTGVMFLLSMLKVEKANAKILADRKDKTVQNILNELDGLTYFLKVLGSYPEF
mgnify:CR=1 FL=1